MIQNVDLFHLENLETFSHNSGFEKLLFSDEVGYNSYVCNNEPNKYPQVVYKLNKNGFRSANFEKLEDSNLNILISGCSVTFGQGVFQEDSWPELFAKKIGANQSKPVKMYNLGVVGASIYLIIKNLMAFIRNYGAPDQICLLLPHHSRKLIYDKNSNNFRNIVMTKDEFISLAYKHDPSTKKYYNSYYEEDAQLLAITLIGMFENFCESKGINLVWSSYDTTDEGNFYEIVGFKFYNRYVAPDYEPYYDDKSLAHLIPENKDGIPHWKIGSDEYHPGACWHKDIAEMFANFQKDLP